MSWQDRLRVLGERLTSGEITTAEYRVQSEEILAEADREAAAETRPRPDDEVAVPAGPDDTVAVPAQPDTVAMAARTDDTVAVPTRPEGEAAPVRPRKVHIPKSAAWEAPSGEMTQIVGTDDRTRVVNNSIADKLVGPGDPAE